MSEVEAHTMIRDEFRKEFFAMPQRDQLKTLVRRAVIDVYGSSWTTPGSRAVVAEAAATAQDAWDAHLAQAAREVQMADEIDEDGPACDVCGKGVLKSIGIQQDATDTEPEIWWHPSCG